MYCAKYNLDNYLTKAVIAVLISEYKRLNCPITSNLMLLFDFLQNRVVIDRLCHLFMKCKFHD